MFRERRSSWRGEFAKVVGIDVRGGVTEREGSMLGTLRGV